MRVFITDEVSCEISSKDIPVRFVATGPKYRYSESASLEVESAIANDTHFMGAVEGFTTPYDDPDMLESILDDEEYPAHRVITRLHDGTLVQEARFGRNMKWFMAINRTDDSLAEAAAQKWLQEMIGPEGEG